MRRSLKILILSGLLFAHPTLAQSLAPIGALERYQQMVNVSPDCKRRALPNEIIVCASRDADRYRLPLVTPPQAGDPRGETAGAERRRLQHITTPCQTYNMFLSGCGFVGVGATLQVGGDGKPKLRQLAK